MPPNRSIMVTSFTWQTILKSSGLRCFSKFTQLHVSKIIANELRNWIWVTKNSQENFFTVLYTCREIDQSSIILFYLVFIDKYLFSPIASHKNAFMDSNHSSNISWSYKFCLFFRPLHVHCWVDFSRMRAICWPAILEVRRNHNML